MLIIGLTLGHFVSGKSAKLDSLTNSYLLNDSVFTITNERFSVYLKGIYAKDFSFADRGTNDGYYSGSTTLLNYYELNEISIFRQDPVDIEWTCDDMGDARSKLSDVELLNMNAIKRFSGLDSVEWFQLEFLRGKLLTIIIANTGESEDYLFTGLERLSNSSYMGSQGLEIQFTADDQSLYGLKVMTDKNGDACLILSPDDLSRLGLGKFSSTYQGSYLYTSNTAERYREFSDYRIREFLTRTSSSASSDYSYYSNNYYYQKYLREQTYWSVLRNSGPGFDSYYLNPVALVFGIEKI